MGYINSDWEFQKLYQTDLDKICSMEEISFDRTAFERVDLPHTWYSEENPYKGTAVYRKKIKLDYKEGNHVFLNFQAADRWCKVFVNQHYVGEHKGGYSAFTFPITQYFPAYWRLYRIRRAVSGYQPDHYGKCML